jgi:hypothetical protein
MTIRRDSGPSIGGAMDRQALARLHFTVLSPAERATAIRRLAAAGQGEYTIAAETGLSVEQVRRVLFPSEPVNQSIS